jgi:hypothetical protein
MVARKLPKMQRYLQDAGCCAIAASASIANYYNPQVDYDFAKMVAKPDGDGMYTPSIGRLLNNLGFTNVSIVSADLYALDFEWKDLDQEELIKQLRKTARKHEDDGIREMAAEYVNFLSDPECENELIIDRHFGKYIRKYVGEMAMPVLASFNWNLFFEFPKWNERNKLDPIKGDFEEHEVVVCGCDEKGVDVVDSHHELYEGRLAKYRNGRYRIDWETLMQVMGFGDLIIPGGYVAPRVETYKLV